MRRSIIMAAGCGAVALACIAGGSLFFVERPTVLRVAVPKENRGDYQLLSAASKVVRHDHQPIRFKLVDADDAKAAADALDGRKVDMAVVRTDAAMPADGQTVVILHRDAAILVVPHGSDIKEVTDLADRTVGIVGPPENGGVLDTILAQYDLAPDTVKRVPLARTDVAKAVTGHTVDVVLVTGIVSDAYVQDTVKAVARAADGPPTFVGVPEAEAVAQRSPAFEKFEVVKGAFHGAPPLPGDDFDTLSVTHRLVANAELSERVVANVTRFLLAERGAIVALDPMAQRMEAPSTEKGSALPAHPGTAAYIDDEEQSFLDQYSDFIYLGAMFFGVIASGGTALFSRLNAQGIRMAENITDRLIEILRLARQASSTAELDALEAETDGIVATTMDRGFARSLDERCVGTLRLALDQVRGAVRDRRSTLDRDGPTQPRHEAPLLLQVK